MHLLILGMGLQVAAMLLFFFIEYITTREE
jgi:hypothetical protein